MNNPFIITSLIFLLGLSSPLLAAERGHQHGASVEEPGAIGSSVEELLAVARAQNPEWIAKTLEADAASARVEGSDSWSDPLFRITFDDISENDANLPGRSATTKFTIAQELPVWGKLGVQRKIAVANEQRAAHEREDLLAELNLRIKTAYAEYHQVHLSMEQVEDLVQVLRTLVQFAQYHYAHGGAGQQEVTAAELERAGLSAEFIRLSNERRQIKARLNGLLNRPSDAPIVETPKLRSIPPAASISFSQLLERARQHNPKLRAREAQLTAAEQTVQLAEKRWFPDPEVGLTLVERTMVNQRDGFEAMVQFRVPLQWDALRANEREANIMAKAAKSWREAEQIGIESKLRETVFALESAREVEQVTNDSLLPQARIALQSSLRAYETGIARSTEVITAVQRLKQYRIDHLKSQFAQQVKLAEIERIIGSDL